jgi:predicted RNA-binding protein with PUA-like domain
MVIANFLRVVTKPTDGRDHPRLLSGHGETPMRHWLMKSEPDECSIDDLVRAPQQTTAWTGVRNYQARNFMRDEMRVGDLAFFYHSSCPEPGIAGIVEIATPAYPDPTQFDRKSEYFDPKSERDHPRWMLVDVRLVEKTRLVKLAELRAAPELGGMRILQRGNRLSITPVTPSEWRYITTRLMRS